MSELKKHKNFVIEGIHGKPIVTDVFYTEDGTLKPIVIFCHCCPLVIFLASMF